MAKTHREEYHDARDAIETAAEEGEIATADAEAVREFLDAKDPNVLTVTDDDDTTKSNGTLAQYAYHYQRHYIPPLDSGHHSRFPRPAFGTRVRGQRDAPHAAV